MTKTLSKQKINKRGWHLVASTKRLELYRRPSTSEWESFYLRTKSKKELKNTWWISSNGKRFSQCDSLKNLEKYHPDILEWLQDNLL